MNKIKLNNNQLRRHAREVQIGSVAIGGKNPIAVQSMTKTNTSDIEATVAQIIELQNAGCDIVRVAVPDESSARALTSIKSQIDIPLVADIHFDLHLALLAIEAGADKIRLNPGTFIKKTIFNKVVDQAKEKNIPIRIGVNSGSIEKDLLKKYKVDYVVIGPSEKASYSANIDFFSKNYPVIYQLNQTKIYKIIN